MKRLALNILFFLCLFFSLVSMSAPPFDMKSQRNYTDTISPRGDTIVQTNVTIMDTGHIDQFSAGNKKRIDEITWFGDIYGDTADFNRGIFEDLELTDTVESLKADGEPYIIFGKDDYTPLWEWQRNGDDLDLYSNVAGADVLQIDDGGALTVLDTFIAHTLKIYKTSDGEGGFYMDINMTDNNNYLRLISDNRILMKSDRILFEDSDGNTQAYTDAASGNLYLDPTGNVILSDNSTHTDSIAATRGYVNRVSSSINSSYDSVGSNSVTINCDTSAYHEVSITGDLTINFNPLPGSGQVSEQTIFINVDASDRALTIQEAGSPIDSTYWINADYIDTLRSNDSYAIPVTIKSSGIITLTHNKLGN